MRIIVVKYTLYCGLLLDNCQCQSLICAAHNWTRNLLNYHWQTHATSCLQDICLQTWKLGLESLKVIESATVW